MTRHTTDSDTLTLLLKAGLALSSEKDTNALLEQILSMAMDVTNADGGTLYQLNDDGCLEFSILRNNSLKFHMGGKSANPVTIPPIPLFKEGHPDNTRVVCNAVHADQTINIPDAYSAVDFDFSGTRATDERLGYHSQSFLTVPLKNHESEIIGVLQLINAMDRSTGEIIAFSAEAQTIVEALASQAAISLTNRLLIEHLTHLFESFIELINHAIDDKSPYTGGHCARVPELTVMIADAVNRCNVGPLSDFNLTDKDRYELRIAGLLHDCGKITTPVHVVDKATKLEAIFDRVALIDLREAIVQRELELQQLRGEITNDIYAATLSELASDCQFLRQSNTGGEFMRPEAIERIESIATRYPWTDFQGHKQPFLNHNEVHNLSIRAGTLTADERQIINHHIEVTIAMLEKLPWPKHLKNVTEYAGGHHERMDGKGYPRGLTREQMSVQARCMAIADVFEALTAADRPYKKGKTLSESLQIMGKMKLDQHIDPDLFDIFIWEKIYETYAHQFLKPEQIDQFDVTQIPGYTPPPSHKASQ